MHKTPSILSEQFLSIEQAAILLNFSESTIRRWIDEGKITGYKMGKLGHIRIKLSELLANITPH